MTSARAGPALSYSISMLRRSFLQVLPASAFAAAATAAPADPSPVKLGYDTYSVRAWKWKAPQLLDYAAAQKLDAIQISDSNEFESFEPAYLARIKDQAARLNVVIDAGIGCVCPSSKAFNKNGPPARDRVLQGLRAARAVGARSMRCFLGSDADRQDHPHPGPTSRTPSRSSAPSAPKPSTSASKSRSRTTPAISRRANSVPSSKPPARTTSAACFDAGNVMWTLEDPLAALEILAPYVVTTHIRDSIVFEHPRGAAAQWVALGDGVIDLPAFAAAFRRLCPDSSMQLEIITGRPPRVLPYLEPDFWKAFPDMPAADFARFVAIAKHGHPFMGAMVVEDQVGRVAPVMTEALKEQQKLDLERSLAYAKKTMNVGVNWRIG